MKIKIIFLVLLSCLFAYSETSAQSRKGNQTIVSIKGENFYINGKPTYKGRKWQGHSIEGLLMNSRMVNGIFDDLNPETAQLWKYPDTQKWDPNRNTNEFIAAMDDWYAHGLLAFTLNLQGGSPKGYGNKGWLNSAIDPDGELRPDFMARLKKILDRANEKGMVVILGIYYFGQEKYLKNEKSVYKGVDNTIDWLFKNKYKNVLIEVINETGPKGYKHEILQSHRIHEMIDYIKTKKKNGYRYLVTASYRGKTIPDAAVVKSSDFILLHGNDVDDPAHITIMVKETKAMTGYRPMPIVFNEDDHFDFDKPSNNFVEAVKANASWGFFDFRATKGNRGSEIDEPFDEGYQSIPVNWKISSARKKGFFDKLKEITGGYYSEQMWDSVKYDTKSPQMQFAAQKINAAQKIRADKSIIELAIDDASNLNAEGFKILKTNNGFKVLGKDAAGAMYGGLDIAETIRNEGVDAVKAIEHNPYMPTRGIKFNIPLDARTPTYSAFGDATEKNTAEMWNFDFWKSYIDNLAIHRYNTISLWSLQPFPMMIKVPEYPDVALNDVVLSNGPFQDVYRGDDGSNWEPNILHGDLRIIKKMTIEQKIAFWQKVMAYGKKRNISFYLLTWNIHTVGVDGKYGINDDPRNEITKDYYRKSVKQLILTYPDLAGIGLTTGENMVYGARDAKMTDEAKEDWVAETYAAGTLDALIEQPNRKIRFIHRQHQAGVELVLDKLKTLRNHPNVDFVFSFKYAQAHVLSATKQYLHEKFVPVIKANNVKTLWTLRNDDNFLYRWGAPDFVRDFIKNIPYDVSKGFYYGHDGFVNGREFTQLHVNEPRQLEVEKHWMQFMLWGRLGYDPNYSNQQIAGELGYRFPEVKGEKLLDAWQKASMVYPRVTGFHWSSLDWMWYIEGVKGILIYTSSKGAKSPSGFHDVETFINVPPHPNSGYQSIPDFVEGKTTKNLSPLAVADLIDKDVEEAMAAVKELGQVTNNELRLTLDDILIISEMGRYYADKIRGSTYVAMARATKKKSDKEKAITYLIQASEHYNKYVHLSNKNHTNKLWLSRVGRIDLDIQKLETIADIDIAKAIVVE